VYQRENYGAGDPGGCAGFRLAEPDIAPDQLKSLTIVFNEGDAFRSAAQGLKAQSAGTGKEIKDNCTLYVSADDVVRASRARSEVGLIV
jgi:hypothetical protein